MRVLFPYIKKYRWDVIWSVLAILIVAFATLWQPHLLQVIMNAIMKNDKQTVWINGLYLGSSTRFTRRGLRWAWQRICVQTNMLRFRVWRTRMLKSFRHRTWLFE